MFGQPWWYWVLFVAAVLVVLVGPYLMVVWEEASDARDRELWNDLYGSNR